MGPSKRRRRAFTMGAPVDADYDNFRAFPATAAKGDLSSRDYRRLPGPDREAESRTQRIHYRDQRERSGKCSGGGDGNHPWKVARAAAWDSACPERPD